MAGLDADDERTQRPQGASEDGASSAAAPGAPPGMCVRPSTGHDREASRVSRGRVARGAARDRERAQNGHPHRRADIGRSSFRNPAENGEGSAVSAVATSSAAAETPPRTMKTAPLPARGTTEDGSRWRRDPVVPRPRATGLLCRRSTASRAQPSPIRKFRYFHSMPIFSGSDRRRRQSALPSRASRWSSGVRSVPRFSRSWKLGLVESSSRRRHATRNVSATTSSTSPGSRRQTYRRTASKCSRWRRVNRLSLGSGGIRLDPPVAGTIAPTCPGGTGSLQATRWHELVAELSAR